MNVLSSYSSRPAGPFSAVAPSEALAPRQEPVESSAPEPLDEVGPFLAQTGWGSRSSAALSVATLREQSGRAAQEALAAFPQVVHLLANPDLHLGEALAAQTGLPVVRLDEAPAERLPELLASPEYAQGFILEGAPASKESAEALDRLFQATDPGDRRVLGLEQSGGASSEVVDHYINQGLLWMVPDQGAAEGRLTDTLLECLVGLPVANSSRPKESIG